MKLRQSLLGALLIAGTGLALVHPVPAQAGTKDVFGTKAKAEKRATELKCTGVHGGGTAWKPCKDQATYEKALQKAAGASHTTAPKPTTAKPATPATPATPSSGSGTMKK